MRGLSELEFATALKECCLSIWIDDKSSFGTFPLESMACGVPVLGKIPDLQPDWINEDNGLWINEPVLLPDFIADFMQNWLEDNIDPKLYEQGKITAEKNKNKSEFDQKVLSLFENYSKVRLESFENQISKTEE
jgi:glycosyltransferase involved in cell wall biosynthesis